ncbi:MAG: polysaccharide deacetylase family protein [Desulfovibrio desulfuricans]|jgi:peptidoglycan/xylan/chitin deacetylase (PgdA/CDA1 family)|nr:polysaccharide deacetylase family protein [Desulfovibrio desulfuricans]
MKFFLHTAAIALCIFVVSPVPVRARVVDGNVIMDQPMHENLCALTFDDGPSVNTPQLLDTLAGYGIPATFFLLGKNAERYPDIVRRILAEGHEVGNHSYSHPNLRAISPARKEDELRRTDAILRRLGAAPVFIRPPYGSYDAYVERVAESLGASLALWSLDSRDWQRLPVNYAALRSTRGTVYAPGTLRGVFLFHDTHKRTVEDLPRVIRDLRAGGCQRFVTLSDYLEGLMDPEPGLLMTRTAPARPAAPAEPPLMARHAVEGVDGLEEPMHSYPAGSTPIPLGRSSTPWQAGGGTDQHAPLPQTADPGMPDLPAAPLAAPAAGSAS